MGPNVDAVSPALGKQSVLQGNHPIPHFCTISNVGVFWSTFDSIVLDGGYLWYKVLHNVHSFVYMTIYDLKTKTSLVFFNVFNDFAV